MHNMSDGVDTSESSKLMTDQEPARKHWKYIGYVFGFGNVVFFPASLGAAQALGSAVPALQLQAMRCVALLLVSAVFSRIWKLDLGVIWKKDTILFVAMYALLDVGHNLTSYSAIKYISVSTTICLKQSLEVAVGFMITFLLTRICKVSQAVSTVMCIVGVVLVTQPEFLFSHILRSSVQRTHPLCGRDTSLTESLFLNYSNESSIQNLTIPDESKQLDVFPGYILGGVTPLMIVGIYFIGSGRLAHINAFVLLFWGSVFGILCLSCAMLIFETPAFPTGATCISLLFAHLGCYVINHTCFTAALLRIPPIMMAILCTLQLTVSICAQYTVLKHINPGHGNSLEIIGAVIVILGNIAGPFFEIYRMRTERSNNESSQNIQENQELTKSR